MLQTLGWLLVKDRVIVSLLCFIRNISVQVYCTVNFCIVRIVNISKTNAKQRTVTYRGMKTWNTLHALQQVN